MNLIEALETRTLLTVSPLTADPPGTTAQTALAVGPLLGVKKFPGVFTAAGGDRYYRFSLANRGNVNLALTGPALAAGSHLKLLDSGRNIITIATDGRISEDLEKGTYYARITPPGVSTETPYLLRLQNDGNWGTIRNDGETESVGLVRADDTSRPISSAKETWVVIHGWLSSPDTVRDLAEAIDARKTTDQVLMLDWSGPAANDLFGAADWVESVSRYVASTLSRWKIPAAKINLIGHSMGGYMTDVIASNKPGGVNRIVALDPATFGDVDFAAHSRYSQALIASTYSTTEAAFTADEAFSVNVGDRGSIISHMNLVPFYAGVVKSAGGDTPNPISRLIGLDTLSPAVRQPWKTDAYSDGFEGKITGTDTGFFDWMPKTMVYKNRLTGATVTVRA